MQSSDLHITFKRYFHDSNLEVTLTNAMFDLNYIAWSLGVSVLQGGSGGNAGLLMNEQEITTTSAGSITLTNEPATVDGARLVWYKKYSDTNWNVATATQSGSSWIITNSSILNNTKYCVKHFYIDANARSIIIPAQFVPSEIHIVLINDLYSGDPNTTSDTSIVGKLITDIPRLQLAGNQDLSLSSSGAATTNLTGNALAVDPVDSCETEAYYGTMTEKITNEVWQTNVIALAVENSKMELSTSGTETAIVRAVFGNNMPSARRDNANFTFAVVSGTSATVGANTGVVTADSSQTGDTVISVNLTNYTDTVEPAYIRVTVS